MPLSELLPQTSLMLSISDKHLGAKPFQMLTEKVKIPRFGNINLQFT